MKKLLLISMLALLLTACTKKECIKQHTEDSTCTHYTYIHSGRTMISIPHHYSCKKTVCDEWKVIEKEQK